MHIGDAGIGAAGSVDSEIVSGFAPAHRADRIESKLPCFFRRDFAGFGFFLVIRQNLLRGLDQIEHLGPTFLDDGIAKDHHLSGQRGDEDNGPDCDDHRKTIVDCKMSHDERPRERQRWATVFLYLLIFY